jgi:hypothetical protein
MKKNEIDMTTITNQKEERSKSFANRIRISSARSLDKKMKFITIHKCINNVSH